MKRYRVKYLDSNKGYGTVNGVFNAPSELIEANSPEEAVGKLILKRQPIGFGGAGGSSGGGGSFVTLSGSIHILSVVEEKPELEAIAYLTSVLRSVLSKDKFIVESFCLYPQDPSSYGRRFVNVRCFDEFGASYAVTVQERA